MCIICTGSHHIREFSIGLPCRSPWIWSANSVGCDGNASNAWIPTSNLFRNKRVTILGSPAILVDGTLTSTSTELNCFHHSPFYAFPSAVEYHHLAHRYISSPSVSFEAANGTPAAVEASVLVKKTDIFKARALLFVFCCIENRLVVLLCYLILLCTRIDI